MSPGGKKAQSDARKERLAVALRENLKRRKVQARAKSAPSTPPSKALGTAPQAGLEDAPEPASVRPNAAANKDQ